jgi:hypothetical protein
MLARGAAGRDSVVGMVEAGKEQKTVNLYRVLSVENRALAQRNSHHGHWHRDTSFIWNKIE